MHATKLISRYHCKSECGSSKAHKKQPDASLQLSVAWLQRSLRARLRMQKQNISPVAYSRSLRISEFPSFPVQNLELWARWMLKETLNGATTACP